MDITVSCTISVAFGLLVVSIISMLKSTSSERTLPGVPKFKGNLLFGVLPIYFKQGAPQLIQKLINIGDDGISYATVGSQVLVSIHGPAIVREVLSFPDEIATR
jgi:hypothetical protein